MDIMGDVLLELLLKPDIPKGGDFKHYPEFYGYLLNMTMKLELADIDQGQCGKVCLAYGGTCHQNYAVWWWFGSSRC